MLYFEYVKDNVCSQAFALLLCLLALLVLFFCQDIFLALWKQPLLYHPSLRLLRHCPWAPGFLHHSHFLCPSVTSEPILFCLDSSSTVMCSHRLLSGMHSPHQCPLKADVPQYVTLKLCCMHRHFCCGAPPAVHFSRQNGLFLRHGVTYLVDTWKCSSSSLLKVASFSVSPYKAPLSASLKRLADQLVGNIGVILPSL